MRPTTKIKFGIGDVVVEQVIKDTIEYRVIKVSPKDERLHVSPLNPKLRHEVAMTNLRESAKFIRKIIVPISAIEKSPNYWEVADGHRRLFIAKELGLREIPVVLIKGIPTDIYMSIASTLPKPWTGRTTALFVSRTSDQVKAFMPHTQARRITKYQNILGTREEYKAFYEKYPNAHTVMSLAVQFAGVAETPITDNTTIKRIAYWIAEHGLAAELQIRLRTKNKDNWDYLYKYFEQNKAPEWRPV
jgi:hypothetical protein